MNGVIPAHVTCILKYENKLGHPPIRFVFRHDDVVNAHAEISQLRSPTFFGQIDPDSLFGSCMHL